MSTPGSAERNGQGASPLRLVRNYIFWSYERGSFHYDVMVTFILLFIFVAPHYINFHDRPIPTVPLREAAIVVKPAGTEDGLQRFMYEIRADDLGTPKDNIELQEAVRNAIEPISGAVSIQRIDQVLDARGKVVAYDATVIR